MKEATEYRTPGNAEIVWTAAAITLPSTVSIGQIVGLPLHYPRLHIRGHPEHRSALLMNIISADCSSSSSSSSRARCDEAIGLANGERSDSTIFKSVTGRDVSIRYYQDNPMKSDYSEPVLIT
jgi:hypothetical protein